MGEAKRPNGAATRLLEPVGPRDRTGSPTSSRTRRCSEPAPHRSSRLLYLPPAWNRASFWLPVGLPVPAVRPVAEQADPQDDCAA